MAVHAHPDDEAISTGGVLARYGAEGVRTVLVTCTDGGCGDGPGGLKPGQDGFDRSAVVAKRAEELAQSCEVLGIQHAVSLGYPDSGMMGWPENEAPGSFWTTPLEEAADRLAEVMRAYQPQVVVTYDPNGFYGHPDHIQAHRITMRAAELTGIPAKMYYTAFARSRFADLNRMIEELGLEFPAPDDLPTNADSGDEHAEPGDQGEGGEGGEQEFGTPDEQITTSVDVASVAGLKYDSLLAHASQADNLFFLRMGRDVFSQVMGNESFVRAADRTGSPVPEDDLFAGLR